MVGCLAKRGCIIYGGQLLIAFAKWSTVKLSVQYLNCYEVAAESHHLLL